MSFVAWPVTQICFRLVWDQAERLNEPHCGATGAFQESQAAAGSSAL